VDVSARKPYDLPARELGAANEVPRACLLDRAVKRGVRCSVWTLRVFGDGDVLLAIDPTHYLKRHCPNRGAASDVVVEAGFNHGFVEGFPIGSPLNPFCR
jgi:hypothetical protein